MRFVVLNLTIKCVDTELFVSGSVGLYAAVFEFDSTWDGFNKIAVFLRTGGGSAYSVLITNNLATIPWECLTDAGYLKIGCYGTNGTTTKPTIWTQPIFIDKGTASALPTTPTADLYEQIMEAVEELDEKVDEEVARLDDDVEAVDTKVGDLDDLTTTVKSSTVAAINELKAGASASAVLYTPQTLTAEQKLQARTNIGANDIVPTWENITGKPSTFPPSEHNHDDRYYTETEVNTLLGNKSDTDHIHDGRYYTESEIDNLLAAKQNAVNNATLETTDKSIIGAINEVNTKASAVAVAKVINGGYQQLVASATAWPTTELQVGSNVYLTQVNIPDCWVSAKLESPATYTYTSDQQFINDMASGNAKIGYFSFSALESQKPDLTNVVKSTSVISSSGDGNAVTGLSIDNQGNITLTKAYTFLKSTDDIDASKIASGTLDAARIPDLPTSQITSGTFNTDRIPSLDASKITSGTFDANQIPNISAEKITSGTIADARISSSELWNSKVTDVTIDGTSIEDLTTHVAAIPFASTNQHGVVKATTKPNTGFYNEAYVDANGKMWVPASTIEFLDADEQ